MNQPKRILATGALGVIGSRILPVLSQEFSIKYTDLKPGALDGAPVETCDLLDFERLNTLAQGCDTILHLAIASGRDFEREAPADNEIASFDTATIRVGCEGTFHILEAARRNNIRRVVFMSSLTVIKGHSRNDISNNPTLSNKPSNLYATTKIFGEHLGELYYRSYGIEFIALRLGQPYPIANKHDVKIRDFPEAQQLATHIDDITECVRCALRTEIPYGVYPLASVGEQFSLPVEKSREIGYLPSYLFKLGGPEKIVSG